MARSFPLAGRADGGNEKSRMTVKNLPIPTLQKPLADFCVHAALGRLRFVSGSTAQLLYLVVFSIPGTGVRVKVPNEKSVRVRAKFAEGRTQDWDFRVRASTASVRTLAENRRLPYRSDLLISKHIRCGHTPEKWLSWLSAEAPFFYFGIVPNPLLSGKNSLPT